MDTLLTHTTVLLSEAVAALFNNPAADAAEPGPETQTYVDATFGRGGPSRLILSKLAPQGRLIAFDKDLDALAEAGTISDPRFSIRHQGFKHLGELPPASVGGVLLDLGISSPQIDNPVRGFSFSFDGPLDMRRDSTRGISVYTPGTEFGCAVGREAVDLLFVGSCEGVVEGQTCLRFQFQKCVGFDVNACVGMLAVGDCVGNVMG